MKIVNILPPIYRQITDRWPINPDRTVFTYNHLLYDPGKNEIPDHLMVHEEHHAKQQDALAPIHTASCFCTKDLLEPCSCGALQMGSDAWWKRFLEDPLFRIDQEAEAYAVQYNFYCRYKKDRNDQARFISQIAGILSSGTYGNVIGHSDAIAMIKKYATKLR
jgi:hypothetical protein